MANTLRTHEENKNKFCWLKDNLSPEFASSTQKNPTITTIEVLPQSCVAAN